MERGFHITDERFSSALDDGSGRIRSSKDEFTQPGGSERGSAMLLQLPRLLAAV